MSGVRAWANRQLGVAAPSPPPPAAPPDPPAPPPSNEAAPPSDPPPAPRGALAPVASDALEGPARAWAARGGKLRPRPDDPPDFAADRAAWEYAKRLVQRDWQEYDEPWAVVANTYNLMTT